MHARHFVGGLLSVCIVSGATAQSIDHRVLLTIATGNQIRMDGYAEYRDAAGNLAEARISGNMSLFSGPFAGDTPDLADYYPFINYGEVWADAFFYYGEAGWCYNGSITSEVVDVVPRRTTYTGGSCTQPPSRPREPHGYDLCPLLLDLDGGGFNTTGMENPVAFFDSDGDGQREPSGWTSGTGEDAFLWMDIYENGVVEPGELFGSGMLLPTGIVAKNGFEALAVYDLPEHGGDGNAVINRRDRVWGRLRLWIDRDHDGESDPREISTPGAHHILALRLNPKHRHGNYENGNSVMLVAHYTMLVFLGKNESVPVERQLADIAFLPLE